jgi:hypothetical protein
MMERRALELEPNGSVEALAGFVGERCSRLEPSGSVGAQQGAFAPQEGSMGPTGVLRVANKVDWAHEESPWKRCEACERCQWWTGWLCRQEGIGFRDCPVYGVHFVETVVARNRHTGLPKYITITLAKGQTSEELCPAGTLEPSGSVEALEGPVGEQCSRLEPDGSVGGFAAVLQTSASCAQQGARAPQQAPQVPNKRVSAQQGSKSPTGINFMAYLQQLKEREVTHG